MTNYASQIKGNVIGVTGPRKLTPEQAQIVSTALATRVIVANETRVFVGDAAGVDGIAAELGALLGWGVTLFEAEGREPWQLQQRSKRMIDSLAAAGGVLHAWPNKECPTGLTANSWKGSGTWGTMYYAASLGVPLVAHTELMPGGYELPEWLIQEQLIIT